MKTLQRKLDPGPTLFEREISQVGISIYDARPSVDFCPQRKLSHVVDQTDHPRSQ